MQPDAVSEPSPEAGLSSLPKLVSRTATLGAAGVSAANADAADEDPSSRDARDLTALKALSDPKSSSFEPTVFSSVDVSTLKLHPAVDRFLLRPYIRWAQTIVRHPPTW